MIVTNLRPWAALIGLPILLAACGGGSGDTTVSNIIANSAAYGQTMTVSVSGSGLDRDDLRLSIAGAACTNPLRTGATLEYQATFSCAVEGVGSLTATIEDGDGVRRYGQVQLTIPVPQVTMTVAQGTRSGSLVIELDPEAAPITALNFMRYVNGNFYNQTIFHRVLPGQIAQGGQYLADKSLRATNLAPIELESNNGLKNLRGTIAMARTAIPDSATAQFYLNLSDNPGFDYVDDTQPGYAVFGRVVSGLEVADEIGKVETYAYSVQLPALPRQDVLIRLAFQSR